jgi:hypothetical protein
MTTPDLTHITGLLLTKALDRRPELTHDGEQWSLSDDGAGGAILWRINSATNEWTEVAHVSLTVDVQPRSYVVVGGVVYTGEEVVTA